MSKIDLKPTPRGFLIGTFTDAYGLTCSIQESSSVEPHVWLGVHDDRPPEVLIPGQRWPPIEMPPGDVIHHRRMHLSVEQAAALIPLLQAFVETGRLDAAQPEEGGGQWHGLCC